MQWTNAAIYDQRAQEKQKAIEQTTLAKKRERDQRQKSRLLKHVKNHTSTTVGQPHEMTIADLRFRVAADGSKLIRIFGKIRKRWHTTSRSKSFRRTQKERREYAKTAQGGRRIIPEDQEWKPCSLNTG